MIIEEDAVMPAEGDIYVENFDIGKLNNETSLDAKTVLVKKDVFVGNFDVDKLDTDSGDADLEINFKTDDDQHDSYIDNFDVEKLDVGTESKLKPKAEVDEQDIYVKDFDVCKFDSKVFVVVNEETSEPCSGKTTFFFWGIRLRMRISILKRNKIIY